MHPKEETLPRDLREQILAKLGFSAPPQINIAGLTGLYRAWCQKVPFDNIRKRIHLAANNPLPLPGHDDAEFFFGWLDYGLGGTCWAGNAALHALLDALGFSCELATATMLTDSNQPPNHGTVIVFCEEKRYLVDASMLHNDPLYLCPDSPTAITHPAWGLDCSSKKNKWTIRWRPLHMLDGCYCRLESLSVPRETFLQFNEIARKHSPFNDALYFRLNTEQSVIGISDDRIINLTNSGEVVKTELTPANRLKFLVEEFGITEEIVDKIPPDLSLGK